MNTDKYLKAAKEAALLSGKVQLDHINNSHKVYYKGEINLVTEVDLLCEKSIIGLIKDNFPSHTILAEESGKEDSDSLYKWIIDPLDGTTNYAHGFPFFCTSIALEYEKEILVGAVYDPIRKELFYASDGKGAFLNNIPITVSKTKELNKSLLSTGFAYDVNIKPDTNLGHFRNFLKSSQAIRRPGSAALDLCYVACGRFDGYWEAKIHPWDIAAGILIVRESRGKTTDFKGNIQNTYQPDILATNRLIHNKMIDILSQGY